MGKLFRIFKALKCSSIVLKVLCRTLQHMVSLSEENIISLRTREEPFFVGFYRDGTD